MDDLGKLAHWAREVREFLRDKRTRRLLLTVVVVASVVISVQAVRGYLKERRDEARRLRLMQWQEFREPAPEVDHAVFERNTAWNQIMRKQRDPAYEIPEEKMELIRKHWDDMTADLEEEEIASIRRTLGF